MDITDNNSMQQEMYCWIAGCRQYNDSLFAPHTHNDLMFKLLLF